MPSVLVTGAGNIGSAVGREFANRGHNVVFYDVAKVPAAATADFIEEVKDRVTFVRGDVLDFEFLLETVEKHHVEGIVHTALIGIQESNTRTISTFKNSIYPNVDLVENILEIARLKGLKVIYISSVVAYGAAVSSGKWPPDKPLTEDVLPQSFPMAPPGPYDMPGYATHSVLKRVTEELVTFHFQEYGMHVCSMRPGSIYGPLDTHLHPLLVMLRRALAGEPFIIPHGGDHVVGHTYNRDLGRAVYLAFAAEPLKRSVYNVTGGRAWRQAETAEIVMETIPGSVIRLGPGMFPNGVFGVTYVRPPASTKAAQEELGYTVTPLEQGIKETAEWMKRNWDFVPKGYFDVLPSSWWVK